jgi:predicted nucleic-acid-binding protein
MIFVDTNYFIRYLLKDVPHQYRQARDLFLKGSKEEVKLFTSTIVIFEIFWVFTDYYKKTKKEIVQILSDVLSMDFITLQERRVISQAIEIYKVKNIEFEDCYNIACSKDNNMTKFATFDKKLSRYV